MYNSRYNAKVQGEAYPTQEKEADKYDLIKKGINQLFRNTWSAWLLIFLYFFGADLIKYGGHILLTLISICITLLLGYFIFRTLYFNFQCEVCEGKRILTGEDEMLGVTFKEDKCYACRGKGILLPNKNEWYKIAINAEKKQQQHKEQFSKILSQISKYKSDIKVGSNLQDNLIPQRSIEQLKELKAQMEFNNSHVEFYQVLKTKAHLILHKKHLYLLQNKWDEVIAQNRESHIEQYSTSLSAGEDIRLSNLFDSEVDYLDGYLDSVQSEDFSDNLIADVKKATEKLKQEFGMNT